MRAKFALLAGLTAAVAASTSPSADQQRERRDRGILVSVATSNDSPVTDLKPTELVVRENDIAREVTSVSPAPPPSHVYLMVDDSGASQNLVQFIRPALTTFVAKMAELSPAPQQALMTFGERPTRRVDFTPNPEAILAASKRFFPINGSGAYFLQALIDATRDLKKREAASPVIVAFVNEGGPEFSSDLAVQVRDALRPAGASLWVVTLQQNAALTAPAARERAIVLGDITRDSGGMNRVVLSGQGIESAFNTVTSLINSRYLVIYGRPDSLIPPDKIEVTSTRRDVKVRASRWTGK